MVYRAGRLRCPRCGALLHDTASLRDARLRCGGCAGCFLAHTALRDHADIAAMLQSGPSAVGPQPLRCPVCAAPMRTLIARTRRGEAALEYCNAHGVWLGAPDLAAGG